MAPQIRKRYDLAGRIYGAVFLLAMALAPRVCFAQQGQDIRVLIQDNVPSVTVTIPGRYRILDTEREEVLYSGANLRGRFSGSRSSIAFAGRRFSPKKITVLPETDEPVEVNNKRYNGSIQLVRKASGRLSVINAIALEDYVKGVAVRETSHYWPMEALKAQAVVFRTFALYRKEQSGQKDFDVTADVFSQGYGGQAAERYRISDSVDQTKGEVLLYAGKMLPAFYHSTCGGRTEDASMLWNVDIPPLKGVACGFCKESPHYSWKAEISLEKLWQLLSKKQPGIKKIKDVVVVKRDASGRVETLDIITNDRNIGIAAKDFRALVGHDLIRSTDFTTSSKNGFLVFDGKGWGHGVGLCQWGAYFMAKKGAPYQKILLYYYPRSVLQRIRE